MRSPLSKKVQLSQIKALLRDEKGVAVVIGLMFVAILALLGTSAIIMTTTDMHIGNNYRNNLQSKYVAEAGIQEAIHRMALPSSDSHYVGEIGTGPTPGWGRYIVLQIGSDMYKEDPNWNLSSDTLDNDSDSNTDETNETYPEIATTQTVDGTELNYLVKAHYKIEDSQFNNGTDNDEVVLYGQDFGYGSNAPLVGAQPVWVVESIGTSTSDASKAERLGEYVRYPLNINANAALACDYPPSLGGATLISGFNHDISTTASDDGRASVDINGNDLSLDGNGQDNHGGKERYNLTNYEDSDINLNPGEDTDSANPRLDEVEIRYGNKIESDAGTYLPGIWTTGDIVTQSGTDNIYGGNSMAPWKDEDTKAWVPLYAMLGFPTQEDFEKMLARANVTIDDTSISGGNLYLNVAPEGFTYIDNAATGKALKFSTHTEGSGLMYITGDLDANNLYFRGMIYVKGEVFLAASFWLLGAMVIEGATPVGSGGGQILYSKDTLDKEVGDAMKFIPIAVADKALLP